jgi:hypothetical protein
MHLLLLLTMASLGGPPKVAHETPVVVFVNGWEELPATTWYSARGLISAMFHEIGVSIGWTTGTPPGVPPPGHFVVILTFAAKTPGATKEDGPVCSSPAALACCFPFDKDSHRMIVMCDRVRTFTRRPRLFQPLLAHAVAHELAHLISGTDAHSETGLMKKHWTAVDYDRMEASSLEFTPIDVNFIHNGLNGRP